MFNRIYDVSPFTFQIHVRRKTDQISDVLRNFHHYESRIRWPHGITRQFKGAVPTDVYDGSRL